MANQLEKTPTPKVLLSERIDRFTHRKFNTSRNSINEQRIMFEYGSHLAEIAFLTMYFGTKSDYQSLIGVSLYLLGIAAISHDQYIDQKSLPESGQPYLNFLPPAIRQKNNSN
jgi:hypothetical protein